MKRHRYLVCPRQGTAGLDKESRVEREKITSLAIIALPITNFTFAFYTIFEY